MTMIEPATGSFESFEVTTFEIDKVMGDSGEYIDNLYARVSQLFNNSWLSTYSNPQKFVFDNLYEFK